MKLPRKLKKQLKSLILKGKDPRWKTSEVRIDRFEPQSPARIESHKRTGSVCLNGRCVMGFRLGWF